jgi:cysteine desulfurase
MIRDSERIYLDHNATTPLAPEVLAAMTEVLAHVAGNPSSTHAEGAEARRLLEIARKQVAVAVGAGDAEIVFTAGATEANNSVVQGLLQPEPERARGDLGHMVLSSTEHPSVLEPAAVFAAAGGRVTRVEVDADGLVSPDALGAALEPDTRLVSLILANNETGVVQDMRALAAVVADSPARLHVDATQAVGKWPVDMRTLGADYLTLSAHKLNGPKGSGCLVARRGAPIHPLLSGGPQEKRLRGGTENVAGIVGLGRACEVATRDLSGRMKRYESLRDRLWRHVVEACPDAQWNGARDHMLPNTLNVELPGLEGDVILQALDLEGVAASAGAACHSGSVSPSHVLVAMGRTPEQARASLRFSVGEGLDEGDIERAAETLLRIIARATSGAARGG